MQASLYNLKVANINKLRTGAGTANMAQPFRLLRKVVRDQFSLVLIAKLLQNPGNGSALCQLLLRAAPGVAYRLAAPPVINAAVNTLPNPALDVDIAHINHAEILNYIMFYNDNFSIVPGDSLGVWRNKIIDFLTGMY